MLDIKIESDIQFDSLVLANLFGRYITLKGLNIKEFEDDYINFYEKPKEMIEYLIKKEPILKKQLKEIKEIEKQNYFWTVKAQSLEVTKKIQDKLIKSLENGESNYGFKISLDDDDLYDKYDRSYWENAYNMNIALAQSRGNWEEMQELKEDGAAYAKFSAITDGRQTQQCNSLHGKVMKIDEWGELGLVPPLHYGCRSTLIQLLDEEVVDSEGKYRPNIKTVDLEQRKLAIKKVQKGFGKVDPKSIEKYVAEKQNKVYNINEKLKKIIEKKSTQKSNLLVGVSQGKPMTFIEANSGNVNPNINSGINGYKINCQSCVPTFEARLRGYDVEALPYKAGGIHDKLATFTNLIWIDPATGERPIYILDESRKTPTSYLEFIKNIVKPNRRYSIQFLWKGNGRSGHIVNLDLTENGELRIKDNQRSVEEKSEHIGDKEVLAYLKRMKYELTISKVKVPFPPRILRIDNMKFNEEVAKEIMKGKVK